jgi:hypothetical protein
MLLPFCNGYPMDADLSVSSNKVGYLGNQTVAFFT